MVNPFAIDEAEGADADDLRIKILYDFAYSASLEKFATFISTEARVIILTPLTMLKLVGR